jgi:UDP-N-acetylmuramyl pentapeptide phosphotransferase/UDP-N-acetylglucosamine-1-phosphate transferase
MIADGSLIAAGGVLACLLTPVARRLGFAWGLLDHPEGPLKIHTEATPRSGGLALAASLLVVVLAARFLERPLLAPAELAVALLLLALGLWDDRRPRSARVRLGLQVAVYAAGFALGMRLPLGLPGWGEFLIGLTLFIAIVNAVNFYDGVDGLLSLTAVGALGVWAVLAFELEAPALPFAVAAAVLLGFLPYNWHRARIFLGDGGSFLVGFCFFLVLQRTSEAGLGLVPGIWVVALPVCDALGATLDRLVRHRNIWRGDRDHIYDILGRLGWSTPRVALALALAAALTARAGGVAVALVPAVQWVATVILYTMLTGAVVYLRTRFRATG